MQLPRLLVKLGEPARARPVTEAEWEMEERRAKASSSLKRREHEGGGGNEGLRWILWLRVFLLIKDTPQGANHPVIGGGEPLLNTFSLCTHALVPECTA